MRKVITEDDLLKILLEENDPKFNITKLCEEMTELQELLLKSINKKPEKAPSKQSIIDEVGDTMMRLLVVIEQLKITDEEVSDRMEKKATKLLGYYTEGKYKGGL
jgi:NTP pyrophosphatase (non-canonical NTP hydrolase)